MNGIQIACSTPRVLHAVAWLVCCMLVCRLPDVCLSSNSPFPTGWISTKHDIHGWKGNLSVNQELGLTFLASPLFAPPLVRIPTILLYYWMGRNRTWYAI